MKYQNSNAQCSKVISKVKASYRTELQNDRQDKNNMSIPRFRGHKNVGTYGKVLSLEILMWYSEALALKVISKVKVLKKNGSNSKVKVTG